MNRFWQKEKGFTLIELLVVVVIIGIVAGIAIPRFLGARTTARVTRAFADMRSIADALERYSTDERQYPVLAENKTDLGEFAGLSNYITSPPKDPFGTDTVPNFRYYSNGDADTPATMWLIISNGPDLDADVTANTVDFSKNPIGGELGGPNGVTGSHYDTNNWSVAKSVNDTGDIGRGGP